MTDREGDNGRMALSVADRALWARSRAADAPEDEAAAFLDLAGFADGRLDEDESERVAVRLAGDMDAAADIVAARGLAATANPAVLDRVIERAMRLMPEPREARVIRFAPARRRPRLLPQVAQWGSLAAAMVLASWLGFSMGSDFSLDYSLSVQSVSDDADLPEMLDPSTGGLLHDFAEDSQT